MAIIIMNSNNRIQRKKYLKNKSNKTIRRLVQSRFEKELKKKMKKEDKVLRANQNELRNYVLTGDDKKEYVPISSEEIIMLSNDFDSPYLFVRGGSLWSSMKKCWLGYKIGKRLGEDGGDLSEQDLQKKYAIKIQEIEKRLNVSPNDFSRILSLD